MINHFDLILGRYLARQKFLDNTNYYFDEIYRFYTSKAKDVKIYLFGSYLTDKFNVRSDIDILVIAKEFESWKIRSKISVDMNQKLGGYNPFEIHHITPEDYQNWYGKFIKQKKEVKSRNNFKKRECRVSWVNE